MSPKIRPRYSFTRMMLKLPRVVKLSLLKVKVGKRLKPVSKITPRTLAVASAFGLGIDEEKEVTVVPEMMLEIKPGDIVLITGDSGSGKTLMLRMIAAGLSRSGRFRPLVWQSGVGVGEDELVVHGVGRSLEEALRILSHVGLNEAFIFLRRFRELSEGQKHRYLLAKAFDAGAKTIIIDDFCSPLDQVTARAVAYMSQKLARRMGVTLVAATTRRDIIEDLDPSLLVVKGLGGEVKVERRKHAGRPCSILGEVELRRAGVREYKALAKFHYVGSSLPPPRRIYAAYHEGRPVAVIVYSYPLPNHRARNLAFPWLREVRDPGERMRLVNKHFTRISRVIVHPKYRGIGLGVKIVRETLPRAGTPIVETLAVMARFNPFFEKAGMRRFEMDGAGVWEEVLKPLERLGIDLELASSKRYLLEVIGGMSRDRVAELKRVVRRVAKAVSSARLRSVKPRLKTPEEIAETIKRCIPRTGAIYLYWVRRGFKPPKIHGRSHQAQ